MEESRAAAKELTKDAAQLSGQAAVLKARALQICAQAQETRTRACQARALAETLRTIPEAAHDLHIAEHTLRHILQEPALQARLLERTRKVGIYYKFIPLQVHSLAAARSCGGRCGLPRREEAARRLIPSAICA